jgi:hypothetical protein
MSEMLFRSSFRWRLRPRCSVTADAAYGTRENIAAIETAGIRAYTALPDQERQTRGLGRAALRGGQGVEELEAVQAKAAREGER